MRGTAFAILPIFNIQSLFPMFEFPYPPPSWWKNSIPETRKDKREKLISIFRRFENWQILIKDNLWLDFKNGFISFPITEDRLQSSDEPDVWNTFVCFSRMYLLFWEESICQGSPFVPQIVLLCSSLIERNPTASSHKECNKEVLNNYFPKQGSWWLSCLILDRGPPYF